MENTYKPIDCGFHDHLEAAATLGKYVKLQYFTDIHEFMTAMAVIKDIVTKDKMEFLVLNTGEEIRLDRVVSIDEIISPEYPDMDGCGC